MSILSNIKYQYNLKVLQDFISNQNYESFFNALKETQKDPKLQLRLLTASGIDAIKNHHKDIFSNKIIWINSYIAEDCTYTQKFLQYYLNDENHSMSISQYEMMIIDKLKKISNIQSLNFNDFLNFSFLYQYLLLQENLEHDLFINNQLPFFSTPSELNFSKSTLTRCYFYVVDHPYHTYQQIKKDNQDDQNIARALFLNLDEKVQSDTYDNVKIEINKKGWHSHFQSWTDPNVMNSLSGKIILKKELENNPFDTLSSVILHLIQNGYQVKIDYDKIQKFIDQNPISYNPIDLNLSQKEKKFLNHYIEEILTSYNFEN